MTQKKSLGHDREQSGTIVVSLSNVRRKPETRSNQSDWNILKMFRTMVPNGLICNIYQHDSTANRLASPCWRWEIGISNNPDGRWLPCIVCRHAHSVVSVCYSGGSTVVTSRCRWERAPRSREQDKPVACNMSYLAAETHQVCHRLYISLVTDFIHSKF